MIEIEKPVILQKDDDRAELSVKFTVDGDEKKLWYTVPQGFQQFLVTENADAFFVGLLFLGLETGKDIYVNASVSAKLFIRLTIIWSRPYVWQIQS